MNNAWHHLLITFLVSVTVRFLLKECFSKEEDLKYVCGNDSLNIILLQEALISKAQKELKQTKSCHEKQYQAFLHFRNAIGLMNVVVCISRNPNVHRINESPYVSL